MEDQQVIDAMPYLNRYALMLTRNKADANDLVSMTIVKAIEIIRFQNSYIEKPNSYLARIMHNTFISQFCRSKYRLDRPLGDYQGIVQSRQENVVYLSEISARVNAMDFNNKRIILAHITGLSSEDIARKYRGFRTSKTTIQKVVKKFKQDIAA